VQLEHIALHLRRRNAWEALDLGHAMLRAWAGPAYRLWLLTFWSLGFFLLGLCWLLEWPGAVAMFILWWLKPLFDRFLLFAFSRSLFGTPTSLGDFRHALPSLLKAPGIVAGLLWRRLSLARSFLLPVWQLEDQRDAAARARMKVLSRRSRGNAVWLTFVCANLVGIVWFGLVFALEALLPVGSESVFDWDARMGGTLSPVKELLANLLWMLAESLIEPFYVASGFSLYLNRRSELEGWDIELAFRRMAARHSAPAANSLLLAVALAFGLTLASPSPLAAAEPPPPKQAVQEVLADPVFGKQYESKEWRLRPDPAPESDSKKEGSGFSSLLKLFEFFAESMRALAWVIAGLVALLLIYLVLRYHERWLPERSRRPPPDFLFGLDVRPDSLPGDIPAAARAAFAAGNFEAGLSLLYRGALVALIHQRQIEFRAGDTEEDCLRRAAGHLGGEAQRHFRLLLETWRSVAYARQPPASSTLDSLCSGWQQHFAAVEDA